MHDEIEQPFDSIESAQEFLQILGEMILETMKELSLQRQAAARADEIRRAQAIELAEFKLKTLNTHVQKGRRVLNDLRSLRRLILNERPPAERVMAAGA